MNTLKIISCISAFLLLLANFTSYTCTITSTLESELLNACKNYDREAVQKLIKKPGVNVNAGDEDGCTPVIIASQQHDIYMLEVLLSLKKSDGSFAVNVNQPNKDGITPLLAACQNIDNRMVEKLLAVAGIDVNQADNNGETPLLVACKNNSCNLSLNIIDRLLNNGAVNKANKKGETPLKIAKGTLVYGVLELYLLREVHASELCNALSAEQCKNVKLSPTAKEGIAFHE